MSRSQKKPKDVNAPKKNQSSYFIFSNERRPVIQLENKGMAVTEISKTISAEWKAMDPQRKKEYEEKAAEQKAKYVQELEVYKKTENYSKHQQKIKEWKEREEALGRTKKKGKAKKAPKKPKQPDSMPKRPQSSYFIFSNERRNQLKDQYPDKKITELSQLIAAEWKTKTAEEKKVYEDRAAQKKEEYQVTIAQYKKTKEYDEYALKLEEWKKQKKEFDRMEKMDVDSEDEPLKVSLPRKPKDEKCPKRPLTSYFLYAKAVREKTKQEFPEMAITDIAKEISKKWKVLTEDEKQPFNDEAARLKEQYKADMSEYNGSSSQIEFKKKLDEWKMECDQRKQAAKDKAHKKRVMMKAKQQQKSKKLQKKKTVQKKRKRKRESSADDSSSSSDSDSSSASDSDSSSGSGSDSDSSSGSDSSSD